MSESAKVKFEASQYSRILDGVADLLALKYMIEPTNRANRYKKNTKNGTIKIKKITTNN